MKLTYFGKSPKDVYLAFSGGIDSVVLLHNLIKRKINVTLLHVNHGTENANKYEEFAKQTAISLGINIVTYKLPKYDKSTSLESFWSKHRNDIFQSMDKPVLTGHHLDDAIEWYIMSSFQGTAKLLNYQNNNIIRPMLTTRRSVIEKYHFHFKLEHVQDHTNFDTEYNLRNKVRIKLLPEVENIFPGIAKTVLRLIRVKENKLKTDNNIYYANT